MTGDDDIPMPKGSYNLDNLPDDAFGGPSQGAPRKAPPAKVPPNK
jgi:hypothetical protein